MGNGKKVRVAQASYDPEYPWERGRMEGTGAWEAFVVYRDMGATRSLRSVVRKVHKSLTTVGDWSVKYSWVDRVRAYEQHLDREVRKVAESELKKAMTLKHRLAYVNIQIAYNEAVKQGKESDKTTEPVLSASELDRKIELAIKQVMMEAGQPTERSEQVLTVEDKREQVKRLLLDPQFMSQVYAIDDARRVKEHLDPEQDENSN